MGVLMECLCLDCGISNYLDLENLSLDAPAGSDMRVITNTFCADCGGAMVLIGKAGDEAYYKTGE